MPHTDRLDVAELFYRMGASPDEIATAVRVTQHLQSSIAEVARLSQWTRQLLWLNYVLTMGLSLAWILLEWRAS